MRIVLQYVFCFSIYSINFWWDMRFMCVVDGSKNNQGSQYIWRDQLSRPHHLWLTATDLIVIHIKVHKFQWVGNVQGSNSANKHYMSKLWMDQDLRRPSYLRDFIWVHAWNKSEQTFPNIEQKRKQLSLDFCTCWWEIWPVFWTQSGTALNFGLIMVLHNTVKPAV